MTGLRAMAGAAAGAASAALALRVAHEARASGRSPLAVLASLGDVLASDAARVQDAAHGAIADGRAAARKREQELAQVLAAGRRTEDPDD